MVTRFDKYISFVYELALKKKKKDFKKVIESANLEQLRAIVEVIVNKNQFVKSCDKFNIALFVKNPRKEILRNSDKVQKLLREVFCELYSAETCLLILSDSD